MVIFIVNEERDIKTCKKIERRLEKLIKVESILMLSLGDLEINLKLINWRENTLKGTFITRTRKFQEGFDNRLLLGMSYLLYVHG